ncbi:PilW family protein [Chromatium okenii]|uniref:Prepilin-type cleavage/methylation domain-containing protein n=1 Tax=Chromatium okenii TaxID=61644 RepID=A0A2S7XVZ9_9GAMM|nr:PilW family protein [Chromatium okenii]PQJ97602.1 hypothetical protein CXB77_00715 [Chromatium okenii]
MYLASVYTQSSSQRGFTLVELMISMTIGLFISAGMVALLIGNKQSYRDSENMARVQENGRFAVEYLARDIRQAGLQNFSVPKARMINNNPPPKDYIKGWNGASTKPTLAVGQDPAFWSYLDDKKGKDWSNLGGSTYTPNTDIIGIRYLDPDSDIDPTTDLDVDDIKPDTDFYPKPNKTDPYVVNHVYYINKSSAATNQPGLYQKIGSLAAQELIECVYDMQLHYGIDNTGDGQIDNYVSANSVPDWNNVLAVKIDLLLGSSEDNLVDAAMSLPFEKNDGTFFTATNRRIYQMFSTTVALRNRMK